MKLQADHLQYTIRGVSREVDAALRKKAAQQKRSLNQLIVDELTRAALGKTKRANFSDIAGRWVDDPEFDKIIAAQRQIDWDKWK